MLRHDNTSSILSVVAGCGQGSCWLSSKGVQGKSSGMLGSTVKACKNKQKNQKIKQYQTISNISKNIQKLCQRMLTQCFCLIIPPLKDSGISLWLFFFDFFIFFWCSLMFFDVVWVGCMILDHITPNIFQVRLWNHMETPFRSLIVESPWVAQIHFKTIQNHSKPFSFCSCLQLCRTLVQ